MAKDPAPDADPNTEASESKPGRNKRANAAKNADQDMGSALRSIYQRTIEEDIPHEMLSLLGKLD